MTVREASLLLAVAAACSLPSCGGGGGGDDTPVVPGPGPGPGPGGSAPAADRFHLAFNPTMVVDPQDATRTFTVSDNPLFGFEILIGGTVVPGGGAAEDVSFDGIIYFVDAIVRHLSTVIERVGGEPQPPLVEDLITLSSPVQGLYLATDRTGAEPVQTIVADTDAGYEVFQWGPDGVTMSAPFPGRPVIELRDPTTGSNRGWLVRAGSQLLVTDPLGANAATIFVLGPASEVRVIGGTPNGSLYFTIAGQLCSYQLDGTFTQLGVPVSDTFLTSGCIGDELVFVGPSTAIDFTVYKTSLAGPVLPIATFMGEIERLTLSPTRAVVQRRDLITDLQHLDSVLLDGTSITSLVSDATQLDQLGLIYGVEPIYFNVDGDAFARNSDGTNEVVKRNAKWLWPNGEPDFNNFGPGTPNLLLLATQNAVAYQLDAFDPSDLSTPTVAIGEFPAQFTTFNKSAFFTETFLITAIDDTPQADLFFVDVTEANSLLRVTDTPGIENGFW